MSNNLILHCGAKRVTRDDLRIIDTPAPTRSWKPIPHADVADLIIDHSIGNGFRIDSEEYGLNATGTKMFGILRFSPENNPEHSRMLGFRNSHDKSFALGLTVGLRVMVCDNLCFGGEQTLHRKHTSGIDPEELVPRVFASFHLQFEMLERNRDLLRQRKIEFDDARLLAVRAAEEGAIPSCDILAVLNEYRRPKYEEFSDPTMWSLFNSFTEVAKKYSPERSDTCHRTLSKMFLLSGGEQ